MDCSECGNTETLSRRIIEEEDEELEPEMIVKQELTNHSSAFTGRPIRDEEPIYQDNQIPIVGNLRRISRENQMMNNQSENSVRYNQPAPRVQISCISQAWSQCDQETQIGTDFVSAISEKILHG